MQRETLVLDAMPLPLTDYDVLGFSESASPRELRTRLHQYARHPHRDALPRATAAAPVTATPRPPPNHRSTGRGRGLTRRIASERDWSASWWCRKPSRRA